MEQTTLFLVQSAADQTWSDLVKMAQSDDCIVLMGDAAIKVTKSITAAYPNIYCLNNEHNLIIEELRAQILAIDYAQFADLSLKFKRCISLK
ncbi:DsrH/TusB family sulfur relay protein [Acinetobacter sp. C32I]|uniref:DsrH/TusB family sulfur relay protein n=1 Tax=Acinetobacter TaxID=469 RepID=UPI0020370DE9|nr:DsrH/TusB family sulfur relay protein [Acinetobacter sp. C32I]USA54300.1 DsrH/TusB family sulfur relay protein [Acinetobacter sp. C32I]